MTEKSIEADTIRSLVPHGVSYNAHIGGNPIISSGTIVAQKDTEIQLNPFPSAPEYTIIFRYKFIPMTNATLRLDTNGINGVYLNFSSQWTPINTVGYSGNIHVGDDDRYRYWMNLTFQAIGTEEKHTIIFNYSIYSESV